MRILGKLISAKKASFMNHKVSISYREKIGSSISRPTERYINVNIDGTFLIELPSPNKIDDTLHVEVLAPDGEILKTEEYPVDGLGEELRIHCEPKVIFDVPANEDPTLGKKMKIYGRVLDEKGIVRICNKQVILYGLETDSESREYQVILASVTDQEGYFSGEYPRDKKNIPKKYSKAYGIVSIDTDQKVPLIINENNFISPKVILVIRLPEGYNDTEEEGACAGVPRNPDLEDFANSPSTFTTDLGIGKCVDITQPNRALEEFDFYAVVRTTEPEIVGLNYHQYGKITKGVLDAVLKEYSSANEDEKKHIMSELKKIGINLKDLISYPERFVDGYRTDNQALSNIMEYLDLANKNEGGRGDLNAFHTVKWQEDPLFYQTATIAHGHILHFKQIWQADGYSMGDLLYSLPLAPCQTKQIAVIDWDRRESAARSETVTEEERISASLNKDRDINEIVNSSLTENMRGGSSAKTAGIGGGLGGAASGSYEMFNFGGVHGIGGGVGVSDSSAWQDAARNIAGSSLQTFRDSTSQAASAFRNMRSTVVTTVQQGETMRVQTESVANHNHCHAITIEYFEVLRHLQVSIELSDVQECLFIPLLMSKFDFPSILRWRRPLQTYLQLKELNPAFDAAQRLVTGWSTVNTPLGQYADESIVSIRGELHITFFVPLPPLNMPEGPNVDPAKVAEALAPTTGFLGAMFAVLTGGASLGVGAIAQNVAQGAAAIADSLSHEPSPQQRYEKFHRDVMPGIVSGFIDQLRIYAVVNGQEKLLDGMDFTLVSEYRPGGQLLVSVRGRVNPSIVRSQVTNLIVKSNKGLPEGCRVIINDTVFRYRTSTFEHILVEEPKLNDDLGLPLITYALTPGTWTVTIVQISSGDGATLDTPTDSWEQQNPRKEDERLSIALLNHLNDNLEYYHNAMWQTMDTQRRFMLLDGFMAPNSNGRSVASVVENKLIGIVGNSLVMPVARGFHLDPTFNQDNKQPENLLKLYAQNIPVPPLRITIPTRGVFAESVMGSCNSCESKDDTKFWRFEESPCGNEPTLIEPISAESRRAEPGDLKPQALPAPMINLQNIPAAPDPTGLGEALRLLGTPNLFKDITGLDQNQKNALAALTSSLEAAKFFGGEASKLVQGQQNIAQQKASIQDSDKIVKTIKDANKDGLINDDEKQSLAQKHLENLVGQKDSNQDKKILDEQSIAEALRSASLSPESDVQIERPNESVKIKKSNSPSNTSTGSTPLLPLPNIPIDPGNGGRSIGTLALEIGDIILSTTDHKSSWAIRFATNSPVSHSILYIGDGLVVEAIADGVVLRSIGEALDDSTFAVALRYQGLTLNEALKVRDYAGQQLGKKYDYRFGVFQQALFRLDLATICHGLKGYDLEKCRQWVGRINLGTTSNDKWFCSELVVASYSKAGVPLTSTPPHWSTPEDIRQLSSSGKLGYVGHLKTQ